VFDCEPTTAAVKPYVVAVQHILRCGAAAARRRLPLTPAPSRRPFLVKALENTLKKLLQLLEHYSAAERDKIALLFAQVFIQRVGVPPENVFTVLLNDVLVANGTTLSFVTSLFREWLRESTLDELMAVLRRGKVEDRLLEFFPQQRRSAEAFAAHFGAEGLGPLVEHSRRRFAGERAKELRAALLELLSDGAATPASATEALELLKQRKTREQSLGDEGLPEAELVGAVWEALLGGAQLAAKGGQAQALTTQLVKGVRTWAKPLSFAASSARLEADLLSRVQTACYDDMALIKSFPEIVRHMYDKDVLSEETILAWYKKGTNPKGRAVFVKDMEKFVTWLQEAEEEDSDEEPAAAVAALKV